MPYIVSPCYRSTTTSCGGKKANTQYSSCVLFSKGRWNVRIRTLLDSRFAQGIFIIDGQNTPRLEMKLESHGEWEHGILVGGTRSGRVLAGDPSLMRRFVIASAGGRAHTLVL